MPAGHHGVSAKVGEDGLEALACGDGHEAKRPVVVHSGVGELVARVRGLGGGLLFQPLALRLAGQELLVHVFNFEIRQVAVLQRMADDLARVRSVDVAVDDLIVLDDHDAVAVALQEGAQLIAAGTVVLFTRNWVQ